MFEPSIVLKETLSLCPRCGSEAIAAVTNGNPPEILRNHPGVVEAQILESGGQVFIRKRCKQHGEFEDLLASDATFYKRMERLAVFPEREYRPNEPVHDHGMMSVQYGTGTFIIFDLTNRCNMKCEPCFMDANAGQVVHELSLRDIKSILDKAASVKDRREVNFLFSGGEPTLSPHFLETLAYARELGFKRLHVATNGIRFAQEPDFAEKAKHAGLHGVFLQIDGLTEESNAHRGLQNFMEVKTLAIENALAAGLQLTLQVAVVNGWNADQVGPLVQFAVRQGLFAVLFQPIMFAGRDRGVSDDVRHARRYTTSHLTHDLSCQVEWDWQPLRDWFPANVFALFGYLADRLLGSRTSMVCTAAPIQGIGSPLVVHSRTRAVLPLGRFFNIEGFLADLRGIIEQKIEGFALIAALQGAMDSRFDAASAPPEFTRADLYQLLEQCIARVNSSVEGWAERSYESGEWRLLIITAMWFQDLYTFLFPALELSTTVVATQEGELPFCAYNSAGWREAVERAHRTATLSEWHREHGRHPIFTSNQLVPLNALVTG
jgi:uncharacterized radical SAM superfamily Fe-S cluster-containing enzyme